MSTRRKFTRPYKTKITRHPKSVIKSGNTTDIFGFKNAVWRFYSKINGSETDTIPLTEARSYIKKMYDLIATDILTDFHDVNDSRWKEVVNLAIVIAKIGDMTTHGGQPFSLPWGNQWI